MQMCGLAEAFGASGILVKGIPVLHLEVVEKSAFFDFSRGKNCRLTEQGQGKPAAC